MLRAVLPLLVAVALVGSACGSRKEEAREYRTQVTRVVDQYVRAGESFKASVRPGSTPRQAARALESFQLSVRRAADQMSRLRPPPKVAAPHHRYVETLRDIAAACQPSIDAGRAGNQVLLNRSLRHLSRQLRGSLGTRARTAAGQIDNGLATTG